MSSDAQTTEVGSAPGSASATPPAQPTSAPAVAPEQPLTVIEPRAGWSLPDLRELWRYRELFFFLALRDIQVRYKQTILGVGWAVAQPLATMAVFALFLGRMAGVAGNVEHYPLFVFAGMVAWTFFGNTVTSAANSLVANERLVTKIYFPRLVIPLSTIGVGLFDLAIASALLAAMIVSFGVTPGWSLLMLPLVVLMLAVTAAGVGVLLSALIVAHRDFKYILAFGVQLWMFATPSLYLPASALGETAQVYLPLNPAYGLVLAFRQCALGDTINWYAFGVSSVVGIVLAVVGVLYFRRVERTFADTI
ncbi:MAG: ABC transporter permease [Planctomycetia bacterium]|nr:ABC transporter permease [Planctomycetia bacterium]